MAWTIKQWLRLIKKIIHNQDNSARDFTAYLLKQWCSISEKTECTAGSWTRDWHQSQAMPYQNTMQHLLMAK